MDEQKESFPQKSQGAQPSLHSENSSEMSEGLKDILQDRIEMKKARYPREKSIRNWIILVINIIVAFFIVGWFWYDTIRLVSDPLLQ